MPNGLRHRELTDAAFNGKIPGRKAGFRHLSFCARQIQDLIRSFKARDLLVCRTMSLGGTAWRVCVAKQQEAKKDRFAG